MEKSMMTKSTEWMVENRHYFIEGLRIFLGGMLFYKGITFVSNVVEIAEIIEARIPVSSFVLAHYVVYAHLAGGAMLAMGLYTRFAALIQIPVVFGASIFMFDTGFMLIPDPEVEFPVLVLILLVVFFFYGSGKWSVDHNLIRKEGEPS